MTTRSVLLLCLAYMLAACSAPAEEDPLAPHAGETVDPIVAAAPPVFIANQNGFYTGPAVCSTTGKVASLSGHHFLQQNCDPKAPPDCDVGQPAWNEFKGWRRADVECRLSRFLSHNAVEFQAEELPVGQGCRQGGTIGQDCPVDSDNVPRCWRSNLPSDRVIIIDIEKPLLSDLWDFDPGPRERVVTEYIKRIAATRARFPNASLGLFGTLAPDARGDASNCTYMKRKAALIAAGQAGLYDQLDYLVPVLYPHFGCDDQAAGVACDPDLPLLPSRPWCDAAFGNYKAYTALGISGSKDLSPGKPLLPLLTFRVHNGNSCFGTEDNKMLLADMQLIDWWQSTLALQLEMISAGGVNRAVLWTGGVPDQGLLDAPNSGGWTINDYTHHLCW